LETIIFRRHSCCGSTPNHEQSACPFFDGAESTPFLEPASNVRPGVASVRNRPRWPLENDLSANIPPVQLAGIALGCHAMPAAH